MSQDNNPPFKRRPNQVYPQRTRFPNSTRPPIGRGGYQPEPPNYPPPKNNRSERGGYFPLSSGGRLPSSRISPKEFRPPTFKRNYPPSSSSSFPLNGRSSRSPFVSRTVINRSPHSPVSTSSSNQRFLHSPPSHPPPPFRNSEPPRPPPNNNAPLPTSSRPGENVFKPANELPRRVVERPLIYPSSKGRDPNGSPSRGTIKLYSKVFHNDKSESSVDFNAKYHRIQKEFNYGIDQYQKKFEDYLDIKLKVLLKEEELKSSQRQIEGLEKLLENIENFE